MAPNVMKEELHELIEKGDDGLVERLYALAKGYAEDDDDYVFSDEEMAELERRTQSRLNGTSKTYSWEEAKKIITGK